MGNIARIDDTLGRRDEVAIGGVAAICSRARDPYRPTPRMGPRRVASLS
jgi:hypothetical protein